MAAFSAGTGSRSRWNAPGVWASDPDAGEHRRTIMTRPARRASKARGNFPSRSWIGNRTYRRRLSSSMKEVGCLLRHPSNVRLAGDREELDAAAADRDEREHVQATQPDGVNREEVAGENRLTMRPEEDGLAPSSEPTADRPRCARRSSRFSFSAMSCRSFAAGRRLHPTRCGSRGGLRRRSSR